MFHCVSQLWGHQRGDRKCHNFLHGVSIQALEQKIADTVNSSTEWVACIAILLYNIRTILGTSFFAGAYN